jgi:hypothetical protein
MHPPAKLSDLLLTLEMDSDLTISRYDRQTGQVVAIDGDTFRHVEDGDEEDLAGLPDWQKNEVAAARAVVADDGSRFIAVPDKFQFHEYRHMERFIGTVPDESVAEELWRAIKGKGAYRYFRDTLYRHRLEDRWYRYRDAAMKEFVIEWAEANDVPYVDDETPRKQ